MSTVPSTASAADANASRIVRPKVVNRDIECFSFSKINFLQPSWGHPPTAPRRRAAGGTRVGLQQPVPLQELCPKDVPWLVEPPALFRNTLPSKLQVVSRQENPIPLLLRMLLLKASVTLFMPSCPLTNTLLLLATRDPSPLPAIPKPPL